MFAHILCLLLGAKLSSAQRQVKTPHIGVRREQTSNIIVLAATDINLVIYPRQSLHFAVFKLELLLGKPRTIRGVVD